MRSFLNVVKIRIFGLAENLGSADARIKGITAGGQPWIVLFHMPIMKKHWKPSWEPFAFITLKPLVTAWYTVAFDQSWAFNREIVERIRAATPLAPLHKPSAFGLGLTMRLFRAWRNGCIWYSIPPTMQHAYRYAVPKFYTLAMSVMASMGPSHAYVSERGSELAGSFKQGWLTAHLG